MIEEIEDTMLCPMCLHSHIRRNACVCAACLAVRIGDAPLSAVFTPHSLWYAELRANAEAFEGYYREISRASGSPKPVPVSEFVVGEPGAPTETASPILVAFDRAVAAFGEMSVTEAYDAYHTLIGDLARNGRVRPKAVVKIIRVHRPGAYRRHFAIKRSTCVKVDAVLEVFDKDPGRALVEIASESGVAVNTARWIVKAYRPEIYILYVRPKRRGKSSWTHGQRGGY